jgi:hypothetical protein
LNLSHPLTFSFWYDVVYHVLSCLPIDHRDASRLYEPSYTQWVSRHFPTESQSQRTLPTDLQIIATLYNQGERSFQLHSFPLLFDSFQSFNDSIGSTFDSISRDSFNEEQLAGVLAKSISPELMELFRIAIWTEACSGYSLLHQEHITPLYKEQIPALEAEFSSLSDGIPGLADTRFMVSHPLRRFGRLLQTDNNGANHSSSSGGPLIVIGLPNRALEIPLWAPVIQGCHEYVLSKVLNIPISAPSDLAGTGHSTRSDSAGYYIHMAPEMMALSIEARLFNSIESYRSHYRHWASRCLRPSCKALAANLPWEISHIPENDDIDTLVDWLSSGEVVPVSLRDIFSSLAKKYFNLSF